MRTSGHHEEPDPPTVKRATPVSLCVCVQKTRCHICWVESWSFSSFTWNIPVMHKFCAMNMWYFLYQKKTLKSFKRININVFKFKHAINTLKCCALSQYLFFLAPSHLINTESLIFMARIQKLIMITIKAIFLCHKSSHQMGPDLSGPTGGKCRPISRTGLWEEQVF